MRGRIIESILVEKSIFNLTAAKRWIINNGFSIERLTESGTFYKFFQLDPDAPRCKFYHYKTINIKPGIEAIVGSCRRRGPSRERGGPADSEEKISSGTNERDDACDRCRESEKKFILPPTKSCFKTSFGETTKRVKFANSVIGGVDTRHDL